MNVIIPRNTTIPAKAGEMFTNPAANQASMDIRILQGEREMARDNWELGRVEVPFTPGAKGSARVGVQFAINEDGILEVLCRDTATGEDTVLQIDSAAVDVDDERVEKMVSESVEFAFEDMGERVWTEAKLKSDELLPAVQQALEQAGAFLADDEFSAIQTAAAKVRSVLDSAEVSGVRDAAVLKSANDALDAATQELAVLLVDRAMEQAMQARGLS
jgi:molecular chaperone DnaK